MRFAPPRWIVLAACAAPGLAFGVEEERYGGDLQTYDFSAFDKAASAAAGQAGSYRSEGAPAAQPSASRPANELRAPAGSGTRATPPTSPAVNPAPRPSSSTTLPSSTPPSGPSPSAARPLGADPFAGLPSSPPSAAVPPRGALPSASRPIPSAPAAADPFDPPPRAAAPRPSAAAVAPPPATFSNSPPPVSRPPASGHRDLAPPPRSVPAQAGGSAVASSAAGVREQQSRAILERMLARPTESQLAGTPVSLASVVSSAASREDQGRRIDAYWALTSAVADYYLGLAELREMARLRQKVATYSTVLGEGQTKLNTRVDTSLKAARAAQHRLAQLTGGGAMPLPSDAPFTGPYATRLEAVFGGAVPEEARLIAQLLPLRLAELHDAADSVARAEAWIDRVARDQTAQSDGEGVMMALELLALNRRALVQIARDYNLQVNRYTQLAAPERVDTGRLVGMLIRTPGNSGPQTADEALAGGFPAGSANSARRDPPGGVPARR